MQEALQQARDELDEQKAIMRERSKELQQFEARRREREREKAEWVLATKEVEHRVSKFHKDSRDAAAKVGAESVTLHLLWG